MPDARPACPRGLPTWSPPRAEHDRDDPLTKSAAALAAIVILTGLGAATPLGAQEHAHDHGHEGLHFTHPIITESVSPDRKIRLGYLFFDRLEEDRTENTVQVAAEWAFHRAFSIEAAAPYSFDDEAFGFTEVAFKFANYAFEDAGILLGYGLKIGIPTTGDAEEEGTHHHDDEAGHEHGDLAFSRAAGMSGAAGGRDRGGADGIEGLRPRFDGAAGVHGTLGSDIWELEPFLSVGFRRGAWELVGFSAFGIPTNQDAGEEVEAELAYNLVALLHATRRFDALLEWDGSGGLSGPAVGEDVARITPGVRFRPFLDRTLVLGGGVSIPVLDDRAFDSRVRISAFWHF